MIKHPEFITWLYAIDLECQSRGFLRIEVSSTQTAGIIVDKCGISAELNKLFANGKILTEELKEIFQEFFPQIDFKNKTIHYH